MNNHALSEIYEKFVLNKPTNNGEDVVEEGAPRVRGVGKAFKDKVAGVFGGIESTTRNKLVEIYQKVWKEYRKAMKKGSGTGNSAGDKNNNNVSFIETFLGSIGVDKTSVSKAMKEFKYTNKSVLSWQDAGEFIYRCLQFKYQKSMPKPNITIPAHI